MDLGKLRNSDYNARIFRKESADGRPTYLFVYQDDLHQLPAVSSKKVISKSRVALIFYEVVASLGTGVALLDDYHFFFKRVYRSILEELKVHKKIVKNNSDRVKDDVRPFLEWPGPSWDEFMEAGIVPWSVELYDKDTGNILLGIQSSSGIAGISPNAKIKQDKNMIIGESAAAALTMAHAVFDLTARDKLGHTRFYRFVSYFGGHRQTKKEAAGIYEDIKNLADSEDGNAADGVGARNIIMPLRRLHSDLVVDHLMKDPEFVHLSWEEFEQEDAAVQL